MSISGSIERMPRDSTLLKSTLTKPKTVKPYLDAGKGEIVFWQDSPSTRNHRASHTRTHSGHSYVAARARASSFGAILFTLLRCNFPTEITVAYDVDANAAAASKTVCSEAGINFGSRRTFALSGWTPSGSRSRLCLGASGLPLA